MLSYSTYSFIWLLYFLPLTLTSGMTAGTNSLSDWSLSLLLSMSPLYCLRYFL